MNIDKIFGLSLIVGILIWFFFFAIVPVQIVEPVHFKTVIFIVINYVALCLGFIIYKPKINFEINSKFVQLKKVLNGLIVIITISYLLRYFDLFFFRDLSFTNDIAKNRVLNEENFKTTRIVFILASIFKSLYFFPAVIVLSNSYGRFNFSYKLVSLLMLGLPFFEAVLKATRKPFLEIFFILIITLLIFNNYKITKRKIVIIGVALLGLIVLSNLILFNRESQKFKEKNIYELLLDAKYNKYMQPTEDVKHLLLDPNVNELKKQVVFSILHLGQYITHGFFEFNHVINDHSEKRLNGLHTFSTLPKVLNMKVEQRRNVYLTFFGAFYIDFRWFTIVILFLFGLIQKYVFVKAINSLFWRPLLVYLVIINVLLGIFCFIRGAGIYPFVGFFILILLNIVYEKSVGT